MESYKNIIETIGLVCMTGFVVLSYMAVMLAFGIVSNQAKQRSAKRMMQAQVRGAFADLETPKNKARGRILAGFALVGILGFTCSFGVFILQSFRYYANPESEFSNFNWLPIVVGLIFGSIGAVAGFLIQREINRRL